MHKPQSPVLLHFVLIHSPLLCRRNAKVGGAVLRRGRSIGGFEALGKMARIGNAHGACDLSHCEKTGFQEVAGLLEPDQREVTQRRNSYFSFE